MLVLYRFPTDIDKRCDVHDVNSALQKEDRSAHNIVYDVQSGDVSWLIDQKHIGWVKSRRFDGSLGHNWIYIFYKLVYNVS